MLDSFPHDLEIFGSGCPAAPKENGEQDNHNDDSQTPNDQRVTLGF